MNFEESCKGALSGAIGEISNFDWANPEKYAMWSAQTFYFVSHSTRLLALAAARCPLDRGNFHMKFVSHLGEESGHENLSKKDVKVLKYDLSSFKELSETQAMYQAQYYWIEHVSPFALFGYILALEGLSVYIGGDVYKQVVEFHGAEAGRFLKVHAEEDISHLADVYHWIEKLNLDEQKIVMENLHISAELYRNMIKAVCEYDVGSKRAGLAA